MGDAIACNEANIIYSTNNKNHIKMETSFI